GTALQLVDTLNLYVTPPDTGAATMVDQRLASQDYRVAIWPVFFLNNLSFGIAFVAISGLGVALAALLAPGDTRRVAIATSFGVAGVLGAVGQLILLGATKVTIDIGYCDCGFKETEVVSQIWAQMLANGASEALVDGASILAAIGIFVLARAFRRDMLSGWEIWSWVTGAALIVGVVVRMLGLLSEDLGLIVFVFISGVLVPVWAIWLGLSLRPNDRIEAAAPAT
ncbi:MAG: hypothetical protein ACJ761_04835, partial [Chloroflexota bacterium]